MDKSAPDDAGGLRYLAIIAVLFALGLICFSARIWTRVYPSCSMRATDYVNLSAVVSMIVVFSLFAASLREGYGRHIQDLTRENVVRILRYLFFLRILGTCGSTLTRISIVLQLFPFSTSTRWKAALWLIGAFELTAFVTLALYSVLNFLPVSSNWDGPSPKGKAAVAYSFVAAALIGDLWCSIMPLFLIWDLNRSVLERYLLSLLMALGLCAGAAATTVLVYVSRIHVGPDALRDSLPIYAWCLIEEAALIVTSCAPLLKSLIERKLHKLGLPTFRNTQRELDSYHSTRVSQEPRWHITRVWRKRHGNPPPSQENTTTPKDPGCNLKGPRSYDAESNISDIGRSRAASTIQMEDLEHRVGSLEAPNPIGYSGHCVSHD